MAHDFAKQRSSQGRRRSQRAATRRATPQDGHWSWFFTGIIVGVFLTCIGYLGLIKDSPGDPAQLAGGGDTRNSRNETNFQFYDYLPEAEVAVNVVPLVNPQTQTESPAPESQAPQPQAPVTEASVAALPQASSTANASQDNDLVNYLLQAGSFQDRNDAESRRASIILLNMPASVVPGVVSGKTWYRVQVGPFSGRAPAEQAREVLAANSIDSIPLRMR